MLKGIDVTLFERTQLDTDAFGAPIYSETPTVIHNVLIAPASSDDIINELSLSGKRIAYQLAIPKGDAHDWTGCKVDFFNKTWKVVGIPTEGIEALIPLEWNKKVMVERYE